MSGSSSLEELVGVIDRFSKSVVLHDKNCRIVVCERGARVLGIFLDSSPNLLWVNPKLESVLSRNEWNTGGLRLWISPERNFFYKKPETFEEWFCPEGIDPGEHRIIEVDSGRAVLEGRIHADDNLLGARLEAQVRREIRLLESRKGFMRLRIIDALVGEYPVRVNPWVLAQVPVSEVGTGTALVPVKRGAEPIHYFVEIPRDRLRVSSDHISFKIDGQYVSKLGIKPEDLRDPELGAIAYVARIGRREWSALILRSRDIPSSQDDCLDVPKRDPNLPRAAIQSYNSGPEAFPDIRFGEIELQLAPSINISGKIIAKAAYDLIALIGGKSEVLAGIRRFLRIPKPRLY
ncbi:MAG: DUF6786 family protein [Nitrososphaerota archaeon]